MSYFVLFYSAFGCVMFAVAVSIIARHVKHRRSGAWSACAILFGPIVLLVLLLVKTREPDDPKFYAEVADTHLEPSIG